MYKHRKECIIVSSSWQSTNIHAAKFQKKRCGRENGNSFLKSVMSRGLYKLARNMLLNGAVNCSALAEGISFLEGGIKSFNQASKIFSW